MRKLEGLEIDYPEEERQIPLLGEYTADRSKSVKGTRFEYGTDFVHMLLKKRLFSSPMAFALTLAKHRETLERGKPKGDRDTMDDRILRKAILKTEEEYSDDSLVEEAQHEAVEVVGAALLSRREICSTVSPGLKARNRVDSARAFSIGRAI